MIATDREEVEVKWHGNKFRSKITKSRWKRKIRGEKKRTRKREWGVDR